jgi:hypothetical protein
MEINEQSRVWVVPQQPEREPLIDVIDIWWLIDEILSMFGIYPQGRDEPGEESLAVFSRDAE